MVEDAAKEVCLALTRLVPGFLARSAAWGRLMIDTTRGNPYDSGRR